MSRATYQAFGDLATGARSSTTTVQITLNLTLAGRETVLTTGPPRVSTARTDEGDTMSVSSNPGNFVDVLAPAAPFRAHMLSLAPVKQSARTLTLAGVVPVEVPAKRRVVAEVLGLEAPPTVVGGVPPERGKQLLPLADGGYLRLTPTPFGPALAPVEIILPAGVTLDPRQWLVELEGETGFQHGGETTRMIRGEILQSGPPRAVPMPFRPEDALWLAAPQAGPWAALGLRAQGQGVHGAWLRWSGSEPPGPKCRLRVFRIQREIVELPFTFKDVPLP
jgi:hypothetical protein